MASLREIQEEMRAAGAQRDAAVADARALQIAAERARSSPGGFTGRGFDSMSVSAGAGRDSDALASGAVERRRLAGEAGDRLLRARTRLRGIPLDELMTQIDDHLPFLLFPVRLETRFGQGPDGAAQLKVRIFPDDILVSTHDPLLSEGERASGVIYWQERARAATLADPEKRNAELAAWSLIAQRYGGPRARYIARQTQPPPVAPPRSLSSAAPTEEEGPVKLSGASAPPRPKLLPDYFVVMGLDGNDAIVAQAQGLPIPETLALGPDPEAPEAELERDTNGRLKADPNLAWLFDYERAVDVGMAVTLPIAAQFARTGFKRVIALGVRLSTSPDAAAAAVGDLLSEHRFTRGVDILKQGSPTNNTDSADSSFTTDLSADEALAAQEIDKKIAVGVLEHDKKPDAQRLAEAIGLPLEAIADWPNARSIDIVDALAMNRALWPATIKTCMEDLIGAKLQPPLKQEIERFFLTYVTGRGLLPAIRVGSQPYGVLATSDLKRWREEEVRGASAMDDVAAGVAWFGRHLEDRLSGVAQMGKGDDKLAMTLRVVGQLASSASFATRSAVTDDWAWNTLMFNGVMPFIRAGWFDQLKAAKRDDFLALGIINLNFKLADLIFVEHANDWTAPVIDRDPSVPLSESESIAEFDGSKNYIQWLLTASTEDLRAEKFADREGKPIPPPQALLYRLLHQAWTRSLTSASLQVVGRLRPELMAAATFDGVHNVGASKHAPDAEAPRLDGAKLGLAAVPRALGDLVLDASFAGAAPGNLPEALTLMTQRAALEHLSDRPTAVLERCLAEHIDLTSHRLDAWQTGLVSRRLDLMRRREGRERGLYLGAYGYVEDLRPKPAPTAVRTDTLPASLRDMAPVVEQADNGGFVHAPSLTHAVTAAVLRNAFLTHAEPTRREAMSVNLTSRRVRSAMSFIEGMRAGQDLSALLGYQFERGLHERYRGIELDGVIYTLRARFPLVSKRLTPTPENVAAERIEARNVIDAYDMLEYVRGKTYNFGIANLPQSGSPAAKAIVAEIERLQETLDAVADLMMAETVHQAVQSNMDRARGVLASVGEGETPPVPDVAQTPRSGRVFVQRVVVHLPPPAPATTPRARANPRLNTWLAAQLPAFSALGFEVRAAGAAVQTVAMDGLDALDLVLMCGDRFGDGSSELERWIADRWRGANGVEDDVITLFAGASPAAGESKLVIDLAAAQGMTPLARLLPQIRALRRLIGASRALHALDYSQSRADESPDPANPKGYKLTPGGDIDGLPARIDDARVALTQAVGALEAECIALKSAREASAADAAAFDPAVWGPGLARMRQILRAITLFGVAEALPRSSAGTNIGAGHALYDQAEAVIAAATARAARAVEALAPLPAGTPRDNPDDEARRLAARLDTRLGNIEVAARQALGAAFPLQPLFRLQSASEIDAGLADPIENDPLKIEAWLQSLARVRARMADLALAGAAASWTTGKEPTLAPVQLPPRAGDPWIGGAWTTPPGAGDIMSVMTIDAPAAMGGELEGLLLDEWSELVPTDKETTGFAFHFDRPSAAAPQALLLAAPPNPDGRWRWEELVGVITDTFDRARLRALEPDQILDSPMSQALPMTMMPFASARMLASAFMLRDNLTAVRE